MSWYRRCVFPLLGLSLLAIPFYRILLYNDRVLLFRDLARDLLAQKAIWAESMRSGSGFPLWNHFALGGTSFYSMIVGSPLHPLNFLFLLVPQQEAARALSIYLWCHYLFFFGGAYLWLRSLRFDRPVSSLMAASLALSGFMLSVHSLGHLLAASAAVPWFFYFQGRFFKERLLLFLSLAGAAIAWPIYAGDPQFTYMLALISFFFFWKEKRLRHWCLLGVLALMAAAAQLLPTAVDIARSQRLEIDSSELTLFSFHPLRFFEIFYPLFFGNRYGAGEYWGEEYVNFFYKTPFIFSIYPGALSLFSLFFLPLFARRWWKQKARAPLLLLGGAAAGFFLTLGVFSPVPIYEWAAKFVPGFGLFRYPERMLFWPLLASWLLSAWIFQRMVRLPALLKIRPAWALLCFLGLSLLAYALSKKGAFELHLATQKAILESVIGLGALYGALLVVMRFRKSRALVFLLFLLAVVWDLARHQSQLVWDQSKHITNGDRYGLVRGIQDDLGRRKEEIRHGGSFRFGSENLEKFLFMAGKMDHTTSTSFSMFENLVPNVGGIFGIEDIAGYFSFIPANRLRFWSAAVRSDASGASDIRFYLDLMGTHYVPQRDRDQQLLFRVNDSAQPYLHIPGRVFPVADFEAALTNLRHPEFRANRDAIIAGSPDFTWVGFGYREQQEERGNFEITRRDGKRIEFEYLPAHDFKKAYLMVNESFDGNWKAYVNGASVPVFLANGWSMALRLEGIRAGKIFKISLRYENPLIFWGAVLTALWLAFTLLFAFFCISPFHWLKVRRIS
ncbi:MAG TPA: hypothetical protein VIH99_04480 [Bdellovibrionota bacterium]|jgi:hypothetical protein